MADPTIAEIKEAKKHMDETILEVLQSFENAYKVQVVAVHITRQVTMGAGDLPERVETEIRVGR